MTRWALMQGAECANVVEQDSMPTIDGEWREVTGLAVGPGHTWDGSAWAAAVDTRPRHITQFAFRSRVTDDIVAAMELAAMHDGTDSAPVQLAKAKQRAAMARTFSAREINLDNAELRAGFADATPADFERIFDAPVRDEERP